MPRSGITSSAAAAVGRSRSWAMADELPRVPFGSDYTGVGSEPGSGRRSLHEPVAESPHRHDVLGLVRVPFDLLTEALHVDVQRLGVAEVVGAPDLGDQVLAGQQPVLP